MTNSNSQQLWIYIDEGDSHHGRSVALRILETLRDAGCPGATILRGIGGYGTHGVIHSDMAVDLLSHLPLVITCVDHAERIALVLPAVRELVSEGLIVLSPVEVISISRRRGGPFPRQLTVAEVMSRNVASVQPDTPVDAIVALLIDRALKALPVISADGRVVGMITDGDLLNRGATTLPIRLKRLLPPGERNERLAALAEQPRHAADLMTVDPLTLTADTPLAQAAALMVDHDLKRLPVIDAAGRLVGMVSRYDLLCTVAEHVREQPEQPLPPALGSPTSVGGLALSSVPTVRPETPLAEVLEQLSASERRRVLVLDGAGQVVGIITDGDVLRRAGRRVQPGALQRLAGWLGGGGARPEGLELDTRDHTAADLMSSPVITVTPATSTAAAIALMMTHAVKRLPVVDSDGHLLGMIGRATVLSALAHT